MNVPKLRFVLVVTMALVMSGLMFAQSGEISVPLIVRDNNVGIDTIYFGFDKTATYCVDVALGEAGLPPPPPTGIFDVRFADPRGPNSDCLDQGVTVNYHTWLTQAQDDTFQIAFQAGDQGAAAFHFSWPAGLNTQFTSLHMKDMITGTIVDVDLLTSTTYDLVIALPSLRIFANPIINDVRLDNNLTPQRYALEQNFPNPFNPSTTIKFAVEKGSQVDVAVYNVIGQKVATLVGDQLEPGFYVTTWNGQNDRGNAMSSGVYYVRMFARTDAATGSQVFSAMRKLLLIK